MMDPKKSLFCLSIAVLCFGSAASSQEEGPMFRRVTKPLQNATLDLSTLR